MSDPPDDLRIRRDAEQLLADWRHDDDWRSMRACRIVRDLLAHLGALAAGGSLPDTPEAGSATCQLGASVSSSLPAANRCVRHPEAERLDGCVDCVAVEIGQARLAQHTAEASLTACRAECEELTHSQRCVCATPDPVMQADNKFHCCTCSLETGSRPSMLALETSLSECRAEREAAEHKYAHLTTLIELDEIEDLGTRLEAAERERDFEQAQRLDYSRYITILEARVVAAERARDARS